MNDKKNTQRLERIKSVMKVLKLTQVKLAKDIGVQQSHISRYLTGGIDVSDGFCYAMILHYGINPQWLEYGEGGMFLDASKAMSVEAPTEDLALMKETIRNLNYTINEQREKIERLQAASKNREDNILNPNAFVGEHVMFKK